MNKWLLAVALLGCVAGALWAADDDQGPAVVGWKKTDGWVAHEWGAIVQDQRHPYAEQAVLDDLKGTPAEGNAGVTDMASMVAGKPVLFLYAGEEMKVNIRVSCGMGSLSFHYPPAVTGGMFFVERGDEEEWVASHDSFFWPQCTVHPVGRQADTAMKDVDSKHWWSKCREVVCSQVTVSDRELLKAAGHGVAEGGPADDQKDTLHSEKFLFYDGALGLQSSVTFDEKQNGVAVKNGELYDLQDVFVIRQTAEHGRQWGYAATVKTGQSLTVEWRDGSFASLFNDKQLKAGLYTDEAAAFWAAWETQFYKNDGVRVIYRLAQEEMDKLLPLAIEPKPATLVRVNWVCLGK